MATDTVPQRTRGGELYAGIVWILSGVALIVYGTLILTSRGVPGVEQLVAFLSGVDTTYIYVGAFLSIFIEGLYLVGNFFPGSTLVVLLSIFSQVGGMLSFFLTILVIFLGWCTAGAVNIIGAKLYGTKILKRAHDPTYRVKDRLWTTWYPAFRANYEVAEVAAGADPRRVLLSSIRVKFFISLFMLASLSLVPLLIDIKEVSNEEGAAPVFIVAGISLVVGTVKVRTYMLARTSTSKDLPTT